MSLTLTILGCGSSGGVPRLGQGWGDCDANDPRNRRRRCSIYLHQTDHAPTVGVTGAGAATQILVDMSPDLRQQLLDIDLDRLDSILLTHSHADHTHGIDDVRPLVIAAKRRIAVHMDEATANVVRSAFNYIFETPAGSSYPPLLDDRRIEAGHRVKIEGPGGSVSVLPFRLHHGDIDSLGYRFGDIAYTPDLNAIPDASLPALEGLDVWIVDALRYKRHPSHFSLEEALAWIERLRPKRAILTNLNTEMDFATLRKSLPAGVEPAYDGMIIQS